MKKAMRTRTWAVGFVLALCAGLALAAEEGGVRKQTEASMLVTGTIDIQRDGTVAAHALDRPEKLPSTVVQLLTQSIGRWRFEPVLVDGKAALARTRMSVRVVAYRDGADNVRVRVGSATFGESSAEEWPSHDEPLERPGYPMVALRAGVSGTVYVVLKVGRDGKVTDLVAEQVNLGVVDSEGRMEMWRRVLANAALRRAAQWTFVPPTKGPEVEAPYWGIRVPVAFVFGTATNEYGTWEAYIPGPRTPAPWDDDEPRLGADAIAQDGFQPIGAGPRLLSGLNPGS